MRATTRVLARQITLFTKDHCGLCTNAKATLQEVRKQIDFEYTEVDITRPENKQWFDCYAFDVPVAHIKSASQGQDQYTKQMHRLNVEDVLRALRID